METVNVHNKDKRRTTIPRLVGEDSVCFCAVILIFGGLEREWE